MDKIKLRKIYFFSILILLCLRESQAQETKPFSKAEGIPAAVEKLYDFERWTFSSGRNRYVIEKTGYSQRIDEKNNVTNFYINLGNSENLVRIYFVQYKEDLILLCEDETWDTGAGFIIRLDGKSLKPKWRRLIPAFNIAQGLMEDNAAYLAAVGFAAKINLDNGKYIWKHLDFYRKYKESGAFNIFEIPEIEGSEIVYTEIQERYKRPPNVIKFDKNSGKVIEVKVN